MDLYVIDIQRRDKLVTEQDELTGDDIFLYRDLIRGYSSNYYTILRYNQFLNSIIGKYVDVSISVCDIPDGIPECNLAEFIYDDYGCMISEIRPHELANGGEVITTENMVSQSVEIWRYENIYEYIMFLFDDILNYVPSICRSVTIDNLKSFILDGICDKVKDCFDDGGSYQLDAYAILKFYITKLLFI